MSMGVSLVHDRMGMGMDMPGSMMGLHMGMMYRMPSPCLCCMLSRFGLRLLGRRYSLLLLLFGGGVHGFIGCLSLLLCL